MEYMTADEKSMLEEELATLRGKRKELSERIGKARELGDLKENAEYHASREDQGLNEAKIRQLEERLAKAVVADDADVPDDMVFIGAVVRLRNTKNDREELYKLVGEATGNFDADYIEVTPNSALGMALMKSRVGEEIRVDLPKGEKRFEIVGLE